MINKGVFTVLTVWKKKAYAAVRYFDFFVFFVFVFVFCFLFLFLVFYWKSYCWSFCSKVHFSFVDRIYNNPYLTRVFVFLFFNISYKKGEGGWVGGLLQSIVEFSMIRVVMLYLVPMSRSWSCLSISTKINTKNVPCDVFIARHIRQNGKTDEICFDHNIFRNNRFSPRPWQKFLRMNR